MRRMVVKSAPTTRCSCQACPGFSDASSELPMSWLLCCISAHTVPPQIARIREEADALILHRIAQPLQACEQDSGEGLPQDSVMHCTVCS